MHQVATLIKVEDTIVNIIACFRTVYHARLLIYDNS